MNRKISDNRTIFPMSLIGYALAALLWFAIGIIMLLLGSPLNMLGSFLVLVLNTALNVFQEAYSKQQLDRLVPVGGQQRGNPGSLEHASQHVAMAPVERKQRGLDTKPPPPQ